MLPTIRRNHAPHREGRPTPLALAAVLLLAALAVSSAPSQDPLERLLPAGAKVRGWSRDGALQEFAGKDLYTYMDGGADIYQEYGFVRAIVQDFKDAEGRSISLEIFEMADPMAALGMFTVKRSGKGEAVDLGSGGELEDYYLNFWKGPYLVTMTGFDGTAETVAGLRRIAAAVEAGIAAERGPSVWTDRFPKDGLRAQSAKYLRGFLGLNTVYPFPAVQGLSFEDALAADYKDGSTLVIFRCRTFGAWQASCRALSESLDRSERFERLAQRVYQDDKGRFLSVSFNALWISVGFGPDAAAAIRRAESGAGYGVRSVDR